jgi:hypothetical protein
MLSSYASIVVRIVNLIHCEKWYVALYNLNNLYKSFLLTEESL